VGSVLANPAVASAFDLTSESAADSAQNPGADFGAEFLDVEFWDFEVEVGADFLTRGSFFSTKSFPR
jgi:hypothetical protein